MAIITQSPANVTGTDIQAAALRSITIVPCLSKDLPQDECFREIIAKLTANESTFRQTAISTAIPRSVHEGLVAYEMYGHEFGTINSKLETLKDTVGWYLNRDKTSIGWAQIEPRVVSDLKTWIKNLKPTINSSGFLKAGNPNHTIIQSENSNFVDQLLDSDPNDCAQLLLNPEFNIKASGFYLRKLFDHFGTISGKTPEDQLRFALAAYKAGPTVVQNAQTRARESNSLNQNGDPANRWDLVCLQLDNKIVDYVEKIMKFPGIDGHYCSNSPAP